MFRILFFIIMRFLVYGRGKKADELLQMASKILVDLGVEEFVKVKKTLSKSLKEELEIKKSPAFIIDYTEMDFSYMLFEGVNVTESELNEVILNTIGGGESSCSTSKCDSCGMGCNI